MKRIFFLGRIVLFVLLFSIISSVYGQISTNSRSLRLSATISKYTELSLDSNPRSSSNNLNAFATKNGNFISVKINYQNPRGNRISAFTDFAPQYITIPIRIRSNAPYEIYAYRENLFAGNSENDPNEARVSISSVSRHSGGLVSPGIDIVENDFTGFNLRNYRNSYSFGESFSSRYLSINGTKILSGSRISLGGNGITNNNYIRAELKITLSPRPLSQSRQKTFNILVKSSQ